MKKVLTLFVLIFVISVLQPPTAQAQFWKKLFSKHKTERKEHKPLHPVPKKEDNKISKKKQLPPEFGHSVIKNRYRIDILIPLQLNTLVKEGKAIYKKQPSVVQPSIDFYEGLKMAADSLNKRGAKFDLYIHDVSDPAHALSRLSTDPDFRKTDLMIGLLQSNDLAIPAAIARKNQVNFISALSPSDAGISDNPYFILVQPTLSTHINELVAYALKKYVYQPKFIFYNANTPVQKEARDLLTEAMNNKDFKAVDCSNSILKQDSLLKLFDKTSLNVVFINTFTQETTTAILNALSALSLDGYRFAVFGMPSMKSLNTLSNSSAYPGLDIYFTSPFYYDTQSPSGKKMSAVYKKNFGGSPSEMVFRGYETLFWLTDLLKKYGTTFNENISDVQAASFTRYKIMPVYNDLNDFLYLENQKLYIFHYGNGYLNVE